MKTDRKFGARAADFLAGKGFYIALALCILVIAVSAMTLLSQTPDIGDIDLPVIGDIDIPTWQHELDTTDNPMGGVYPVDGMEPSPAPPAAPDEANPPAPEYPTNAPDEEAAEANYLQPDDKDTSVLEVSGNLSDMRFVWPVFGEIVTPHATNELIYDRTMGDWRTHSGINIAASLGEPVRATHHGTVTRVFDDPLHGTTVIIDHGGGIQSLYANLAEQPSVETGQWVDVGTFIGSVGSSSIVSASLVNHLHFRLLQDGESINPLEHLPED